MKKPHLIYIIADQLRYDVLGKGYTPHIDSIAAQGVRFDRAYCACPLCAPARAALFTGTVPNTNGSLINPWLLQDKPHGFVREGIDNLYDMMERAHYDCLHSGKQHLFLQNRVLQDTAGTKTRWLTTEQTYASFLKENGVRAPGGPQFRTPVPEMSQGKHTRVATYSNANTGCYAHGTEHYFDGYFTDNAIEGLKTRDKSKPLFLSAMFLAPHPPLEIPEPYFSAVRAQDVLMPENVGTWYPHQSPLQMYNLPGIVGARYTNAQWREAWRTYLGLVSLLDDCVGRLLAALTQQGIYDDCIILFTADHGEMLGSHKLFQKMCLYEEAVRVPLFLKLPQAQCAGSSLREPVSHVDVQPTLCALLGTTFHSKMDGSSLLDALRGETHVSRDVFLQYDGNGSRSNFQRGVISGDHKLIVDLFKDEIYFELYNLAQDPQEMHNLLFEPAQQDTAATTAQRLLETLTAHMRSTNDLLSLPSVDWAQFVRDYGALPARA